MQPHSVLPFEGTTLAYSNIHHQYAIEGYCAPKSVQSNVTAASDLLEGGAPATSQYAQQITPPSTPQPNVFPKMFSNSALYDRKGVDIGSDRQQQSSRPISTFTCGSPFYSTIENDDNGDIGALEKEDAQSKSTFTTVNNGLYAPLFPTLFAKTHNNPNTQQITHSEQQDPFQLRNNLAIGTLPSHTMNPMSEVQPQSRFPAEVDTFIQSYQFAPLLPTISRSPPRISPPLSSKVQANDYLPSSMVNTLREPLPYYDTEMQDIRGMTDTEISLASEPLYGLGITGISLDSAPLSLSRSNNGYDTSSLVVSPPKNYGVEDEHSDNTYFESSPAPSPLAIAHSTNYFRESQQKKVHKSIGQAKLESGFTPLIPRGEGSRAMNESKAKENRSWAQGILAEASPVLTQSASFGPPLSSSTRHIRSDLVINRIVAKAASEVLSDVPWKSLSEQAPPEPEDSRLVFLALDQEHVDFLVQQMEHLSGEQLKQVEIRMFDPQAILGDPSVKFNLSTFAALRTDQRKRLIAFSKEHYQLMKQSMTPEVGRHVTLIPVSQAGHPRPVIKLEIPPPPLTEFHLFPKLPTELQHRIWKICLPGPRRVHLTSASNRPALEIFKPKEAPPTILQVCAQSRAVAKCYLQPAFENTIQLAGAYTYFNFKLDSLYLYNGVNVETAKALAYTKNPSLTKDRERVQHLEIPFHLAHHVHQYNCVASLVLSLPQRGWKALRTLTFPGCPLNKCGEGRYRMAVIEVDVKNAKVLDLIEAISAEFHAVWEEWKGEMPNCGLKVVYLGEGEI